MLNLTSLQSIDFGSNCFNGASSFSLIGIVDRKKWWIDLPHLQSVKLGDYAFQNTGSFTISNLTSLQSIVFGSNCFINAPSFSLTGLNEWMKWRIDLPQLQSVKLGDNAFQSTRSFEMLNHTSLQTIEIGQECFNGASLFSLTGLNEMKEMMNRSSSPSISEIGWLCIQ